MVKANPELLRDPATGLLVPASRILEGILADDPARSRTNREVIGEVHRLARVLRYVVSAVGDVSASASGATPSPTSEPESAGHMSLVAAVLQVLAEDGAWWSCGELVDHLKRERLTRAQVNSGSVGQALTTSLKAGSVERRPHEGRRGQYQWRTAQVSAPTPAEPEPAPSAEQDAEAAAATA